MLFRSTGDKITYANLLGSYAETRIVPADRMVILPGDISDELAAAAYLRALTAEYLLKRLYPVEPGETILVHAAAGGVGLVALLLLGRQLGGLLPRFAEWVDGLGFWGPAVFIAGYVVTTIAFVPGAVMTLAAGAVFGLAKATVYVLTGATIGSAVAFLISRHLAREALPARVPAHPRRAPPAPDRPDQRR